MRFVLSCFGIDNLYTDPLPLPLSQYKKEPVVILDALSKEQQGMASSPLGQVKTKKQKKVKKWNPRPNLSTDQCHHILIIEVNGRLENCQM